MREEGEGRHPITLTASRIEVSHRRIRDDLAVLEQSEDLGRVAAVVRDLVDLLKQHFWDEEEPDGLFDELASLRPALAPELDLLRQDHREIMQALEVLRRHLDGLDKPGGRDDPEEKRDEIRVRTSVFLQLIHLHERTESRIVGDTYYSEDGGSG